MGLDPRGRLYLRAWIRRQLDEDQAILLAALRPDAATVVVTAAGLLDAGCPSR